MSLYIGRLSCGARSGDGGTQAGCVDAQGLRQSRDGSHPGDVPDAIPQTPERLRVNLGPLRKHAERQASGVDEGVQGLGASHAGAQLPQLPEKYYHPGIDFLPQTPDSSSITNEGQPGLNLQEATGLADENQEQEPAMKTNSERIGWPQLATDNIPSREALLARVSMVPITGCWMWMSTINAYGYGVMMVGKKRPVQAHRLTYHVWGGTLVKGMELDHLCRHRWCVNPAHLEQVTRRVNHVRGLAARGYGPEATSCRRGHQFSEVGRYLYADGRSACRACEIARTRLRRESAV